MIALRPSSRTVFTSSISFTEIAFASFSLPYITDGTYHEFLTAIFAERLKSVLSFAFNSPAIFFILQLVYITFLYWQAIFACLKYATSIHHDFTHFLNYIGTNDICYT